MDLIQEIILQHGRSSLHKGKMKNPAMRAEMNNPLCGDSLRIDMETDGNCVKDICFSGEGCLISQASASLLVGKAKKVKDLNKIKRFNEDTVFKLLGISLTPSRIQCAILSLKTLRKALASLK